MLSFIYHWSKSIQQLPTLLTAAYEACLACGELEYAGYCGLNKVTMLFYQGISLAQVQQEALQLLQFAHNTKNQMATDTLQAIQRLLANLRGDTLDEWNFDTSTINEAKFEEGCQQANSFYALCFYHIFKAQAFYLYSHFEQAFRQLTLAKKYLAFIVSHYETAIFNWYESLTLLALYPTASHEDQQAYLQQVTQNQQQMQKWQASCPENFAHKYALVEAELAQLKEHYEQAEVYYDQAIELAGRHGFIQEQALAAERTAQYWMARSKPTCAQGYLDMAFNGYKQWGAKRKLIQFKAKYSDLLRVLASPSLSPLNINQETTLSSSTLKFLDLSSILKASQAISSEIELPKVLHKMIQIVIENAGAQQGALLFVEADDTIVVQAEYARNGTITTLQKLPLANWNNGARAVIQYIIEYAKKHPWVVVDNALTDERFKSDPYISHTQAKSILCIPLLKHTKIIAILYVENNLMSHAFTPERVQTVQILTAQMVISLENAGLYESIRSVTERLNLALKFGNIGTWSFNLHDNKVIGDGNLYALYGVNPSESTYENFMAVIHPDDQAYVELAIKQALEEGVPYKVEFRVIHPANHSVHILAAQGEVYHNAKGQPERLIGVNWDITQQKRLEEKRLLAAVLEVSQAIQPKTLFDQFANLGQDWDTVKKELVVGASKYASQKKEIALGHMQGLVEYRDILDYAIYRHAVETIFPATHYEIITRLGESIEATPEREYQFKSAGYTFIVHYRPDPSNQSRPRCEIKVQAPGSRALTSDIDTSIYVTGVTGAHTLDLTFADPQVREKGPDYNGRVRNQVIAHFYRLSEELHHMTSSESRDSNAYADTITEDESEYPKFNFTPDNNPIINGQPVIQDPQFYAKYKLSKHYQEQAASLIALRRAFLTAEEWKGFKDKAITQLQHTLQFIYPNSRYGQYFNLAKADIKEIFRLAETFYQDQEGEQMLHHKIAAIKLERADYWASSPLGKSPELLAVDMKISAKNTLYVEYLEKVTDTHNEIINLTQKQQALIDQLEQLHQQRNAATKQLEDLGLAFKEQRVLAKQAYDVLTQQMEAMEQQLLSHLIKKADKRLEKQNRQIKANLFAHEAYISRSAIYHIVKGMVSKGQIKLSKQTVMGSGLQQIGFRIQHANQLRLKHKSEGEIAYYCAKYSQRVFDLLFNSSENVRKSPFLTEQIEMLVQGSQAHNFKILSHLKATELQAEFLRLFSREEYHLINSEMQVVTQVKKNPAVSETDKVYKTLALLKSRMHLINKDAYPDKEKITHENMRDFAEKTEKNLFESMAAKLIAAVYAAKLELNQGNLWGPN